MIQTVDAQPWIGSPTKSFLTMTKRIPAKKAEHSGSNKWYRGKSDNAIYSIQKKFPERPFGFPSYPFYIFVVKPFCTKSYPSKETFGKSVVF